MEKVRLAKKAVQSRADHGENSDSRNRQGRPQYGGGKILLGPENGKDFQIEKRWVAQGILKRNGK